MVTRREALTLASKKLKDAGVEHPWFEAQVLLSAVIGINAASIIAHDEEFLTKDQEQWFINAVDERQQRKPLAYITRSKHFLAWEFYVNNEVLIPRPETEELVLLAVKELSNRFPDGAVSCADIGTGSGVIGLSILALLPRARLAAVDISQTALAAARINAERLGVQDRVSFFFGDMLGPVRGELHCIAANLPYISEQERETLQPEVLNYEPTEALFSGADGLDHYRILLRDAWEYLLPGGLIFVEIGSTQAEQVEDLFRRGGFRHPRAESDLAGKARIIWAAKD